MTAVIVIILFCVGGFLAFAATRPAEFSVKRSLVIHAPAEAIFPLVNSLAQWSLWSPWDKMDPTQQKTLHGSESGVGASLAWVGKKTGVGRMEITESVPASRIVLRLNFEKPMKAENFAIFTFTPEGDSTRVEWEMNGRHANLIGKCFGLVCNMDKMVGSQFAQGLADLAQVTSRSA